MYKIALCVSNTFYSAVMCVTVSAGPKEDPQTLGPAEHTYRQKRLVGARHVLSVPPHTLLASVYESESSHRESWYRPALKSTLRL